MNNNITKPDSSKRRKKLGEILLQAGLIDQDALDNALKAQKIQKKKLGQILIESGVTDDIEIARALADQLKLKFIRITGDEDIPNDITSLIPPDMAESHLLIPLRIIDKRLIVAMANPLDQYAYDDLRFLTQMPTQIIIAPESDIRSAIKKYYSKGNIERELGFTSSIQEHIELIRKDEEEEKGQEDIMDLTERPPVIRFTNSIFADALNLNASDIHIEPQKASMVIRYRIDGVMHEIMEADKHIYAPFASRIKILSNIDISVKRKPNDGKMQIRFKNQTYDLRVSTIPTTYGESVTIRILHPDMGKFQIENLGLSENDMEGLNLAVTKPQGIILVTGPTGSGKSSTLYACLNRLNASTVKIITVEDPIEYEIQGVNQVQINPKAGITFAEGLRSILRQDPDIVMVGEIRDRETASIAFQAAQTGHLVLSTLHTNDAPSTITRLFDLGVESYICGASLTAVIGQRLVRKICEKCKIPEPLSPQIKKAIPPEYQEKIFYKGAGCEACQYTGYSGRMAIFEVLMVTSSIKEAILNGDSVYVIKNIAMKEKYVPLFYDGLRKAGEGTTSVDEVFRVASPEEDEGTPNIAIETGGPSVPALDTSGENPVTILVVDDSEDMLRLITHILEPEEYLTITAKNGLEGLKLALRVKPDLIITDLLMPVMDGITLIKKLKSQIETRLIPIMMLTAKDDVDSEVEVIDAGARDYLTKPVNAKRLIARVHRILGKQ